MAALWLMLAAPQQAAAQDILSELSSMQDAAFDVPLEAPDFAARNAFLAVRDRAATALATETDPQRQAELRRYVGVHSFYAAESFDAANEDDVLQKIALLDETRRLLADLVISEQNDANSYEYRIASARLFDFGQDRDDPRWTEWSADRVRASRYRAAQFANDPFEKNALAQALFDHGWLIKDQALIAEAEQITSAMAEADARSDTRKKLERVTAGNPPY